MKIINFQTDRARKNSGRNSGGFTLIELMIATIIFSMVMLVILASFLQIGRMYYKGISLANTQEAARKLTATITDDIRFTSYPVNYSFDNTKPPDIQTFGNAFYFCVGSHRYAYSINQKVTPADYQNPDSLNGVQQASFKGAAGVCPSPGDTDIEYTEKIQLLGPDMQLNKFNYICQNGRCDISLHILYYGGDDKVFASADNPNDPAQAINDPDAYCTGSLLSSQFCGAVDLNTTVLARE